MKRIVDIFSKNWSPDIIWTYVIDLDGVKNTQDLKIDTVTVSAFENEALRLAMAENRGDTKSIFAKVRE